MKTNIAKHIFVSLSTLLLTTSWSALAQEHKATTFSVDRETRHQTIDNFGASDAWRIAFVGSYWPMEKREKIADLLFSTEFDKDGNPIGIGLSNWRVNIGAGSYENRENKEVTSDWNRTECFLSPDGSYDFSKQAGQQWFMEAARKRGVDDFLFFTNSAPYFMTRSGSTLSPDRDMINLQEDKFDDFANFLAITTKHFTDRGFNVRYISPLNEPQIDWGQNKWQEGSFATNADAYKLIKELSRAITEYDVPTQVVFGEAADMKYLFECDSDEAMPDNIIEEFFTKDGKYNIMAMDNIYDCVTAHDYWSAYPANTLVQTRERIKEELIKADGNTKFWASEYCILEKNDEITMAPSPTKSINLGLYTARIIHADLAIANASAWQWWTAISLGEDVPIQLLPNPNATGGSLKYDGIISPTKMHWTTGNYSLFIRPGMWRISLDRDDDITELESATTLMGSAYTDGKRVVMVFINYEETPREIDIECKGSSKGEVYVTSIDKDLEYIGAQKLSKITIEPKSVMTVVVD